MSEFKLTETEAPRNATFTVSTEWFQKRAGPCARRMYRCGAQVRGRWIRAEEPQDPPEESDG